MTGPELRLRRQALHYTQQALADRWGLNRETIYRFEKDKHPVPKWVDDALAGIAWQALQRVTQREQEVHATM